MVTTGGTGLREFDSQPLRLSLLVDDGSGLDLGQVVIVGRDPEHGDDASAGSFLQSTREAEREKREAREKAQHREIMAFLQEQQTNFKLQVKEGVIRGGGSGGGGLKKKKRQTGLLTRR